MISKNSNLKKRNFLILILISLIITGFLILFNLKINQKRFYLRSQIESLKKEIQFLEEKNQKLRAEISQGQTQDFLEKKARENLNLKKTGEGTVVILPLKENKQEKKEEKKNFWQKILDPIKNLF